MPVPFEQHPLRQTLNDEVHARPPVPLHSPEAVTYLAFLHHDGSVGRELRHLAALCAELGLPEPEADCTHLLVDAGPFRFKWERHNEFSSYAFFRPAESGAEPPWDHALQAVPEAWRRGIPGQLVTATHVLVRPRHDVDPEALVARHLAGTTQMVVSKTSHGAGWVFTDFRIHDGFSRFLVVNDSLTPRQAGRTVQRLVEIETYRVIGLLAFPIAKQVARLLSRAEDELADLVLRMGRAETSEGEHRVLGRLTRLAADVEQSIATHTYRFGASAAYWGLVRARIEELREIRVTGFPTLREFMDRRLQPAMDTCAIIARRQEELSGRIARNAQLLRTRVEVELERQNQQLLEQMNRRARLQLRLQETVEGLSVVAITYYGSQLVHYVAKGLKDHITPVTPETATAAAIPVIAGLVFLGLRRMRKRLAAESGGSRV